MKYIFIVNPAAGKVDPMTTFRDAIDSVCKKCGLDYEFAATEHQGHATEIAAKYADAATADEPVRIFSVGGDGTLCEVANGLMNKPNCELGVIPCGSGNDYIKTFGEKDEFLAFEEYFTSGSIVVDAIHTTCSGTQLNSLNIASLGFDANVCSTANELKSKNKKLSSSKAYIKAIVINFFRKVYNTLTITIDDSKTFSGKYLFTLAANGQWYGGGWHSAPVAVPDDGKLEMIFVKKLSRIRMLEIIGSYQKGTYLGKKKYRKIITHHQGTKMRVTSKKPAVVNVDGECFPCNDVTFEIMPGAVRFIVPQKYINSNGISEEKENQPALV